MKAPHFALIAMIVASMLAHGETVRYRAMPRLVACRSAAVQMGSSRGQVAERGGQCRSGKAEISSRVRMLRLRGGEPVAELDIQGLDLDRKVDGAVAAGLAENSSAISDEVMTIEDRVWLANFETQNVTDDYSVNVTMREFLRLTALAAAVALTHLAPSSCGSACACPCTCACACACAHLLRPELFPRFSHLGSALMEASWAQRRGSRIVHMPLWVAGKDTQRALSPLSSLLSPLPPLLSNCTQDNPSVRKVCDATSMLQEDVECSDGPKLFQLGQVHIRPSPD